MSIRLGLSYLIALLTLLNFVDGAMPQVEMHFLSGRCPVPAGAIKLLVLGLLVFGALLLRVRLEARRNAVGLIALFITYCICEMIQFSQSYDFSYVIFSFENYYFYMLLIPLFFVLRPTLPTRFWIVSMLVMAAVLGAIGFWQGYSDTALLRITSTDGNFQVRSSIFFGEVRAFSLFSNSGTFGNFLCIAGSFMWIGIFQSMRWPRRAAFLAFFLFLGVVAAMTLSRSVYYEFILSVLTATLLLARKAVLIRPIPLVYGGLGLLMAYAIPLLQAMFGASIFGMPVLDDTTQQLRLMEWSGIWQQVIDNPASFFFGTGVIQSTQYANLFSGSIDNIFLAVLFHIGFIGLVLYLAIMGELWRLCTGIARQTRNSFALACIAAFSTWMILGMFTIQPTGFPLIFVFALMSSGLYEARPAPARLPKLRLAV